MQQNFVSASASDIPVAVALNSPSVLMESESISSSWSHLSSFVPHKRAIAVFTHCTVRPNEAGQRWKRLLVSENNALNRSRREGALVQPLRARQVCEGQSHANVRNISTPSCQISSVKIDNRSFLHDSEKETVLFFSCYRSLFLANCSRYHWGEKTVE